MQSAKVSIVIPTWQRSDLLRECVEHILDQTYKNTEIIIVVDGQDPSIEPTYRAFLAKQVDNILLGLSRYSALRLIELGRNWSGLDKKNFGYAPLLTGYWMATGLYIMPWCDDERALTNKYIERLVEAMETPIGPDESDNHGRMIYPDFVYSRVHIWRNGAPDNHENTIIGVDPPTHGQITNYMFNWNNFIRFGYPNWNKHPVDWTIIETWLANKANYVMLDECMFEHRLDQ